MLGRAIAFALLQLGNDLLCSQSKKRRGRDLKAGLFNLSISTFNEDALNVLSDFDLLQIDYEKYQANCALS